MANDIDPFKLSSPRIFLVRMLVFLILCALVVIVLYRQIWTAFLANPGLNALIIGVLVIGTALALVAGKPLGVVGATWVAVRMGWCRLAPGVSWGGVCLVGLLAGIGFTMSIFISMLAFSDEGLLRAAKLGVLFGSLVAATLGLGWGATYVRRQ